MLTNRKGRRGQSVLEYVMLVGIVTIVLVNMMQYVKRGNQSIIKVAADQLGQQENSDQSFESRQGYLDSSNFTTDISSVRAVRERSGVINYSSDSQETIFTNTYTNMGFTQEYR